VAKGIFEFSPPFCSTRSEGRKQRRSKCWVSKIPLHMRRERGAPIPDCGGHEANALAMSGMATQAPKALPMLVKTTIRRMRVILFLQNPLKDRMSS